MFFSRFYYMVLLLEFGVGSFFVMKGVGLVGLYVVVWSRMEVRLFRRRKGTWGCSR